MGISRYIVPRATVPDPLPDTVLRRTVRELLMLARVEQQRMAGMGLEERRKALGDAVDARLDREAKLDRLIDHGAAERLVGYAHLADAHLVGVAKKVGSIIADAMQFDRTGQALIASPN